MAWVDEYPPQINKGLELVMEDLTCNELSLPTYVYFTVGIRGIEVRLGIDTGSAHTLLSEEIFQQINADSQYQLQTAGTSFEAVNGSRVECLGMVKLPVRFYGVVKNYQANIEFYIIRNLGLQGLFGLDELTRHKFCLNTAEPSCYQEKTGQIIIDFMYRESVGIRGVSITEEVTLPPLTSCDIKVDIEAVDEGIAREGIIYPRNNIYEIGVRACRVLTVAKPTVVTRVMNLSDQNLVLFNSTWCGQIWIMERC